MAGFFLRASAIASDDLDPEAPGGRFSGTEMMTPFPVPIHRRKLDTRREVMRTKLNPSFPLPVQRKKTYLKHVRDF